MKTARLLGFVILNLLVLNVSVSPLFAKAPTTPKILFTSTRDGNYEVYIMNPDGTEQVNLTQHPGADLHAVWSPTGEQILFISDRDDVRDLYLMDSDGRNVRRVFKKEALRGRPAWSPDGKKIAYMHLRWDTNEYPIYTAMLGEQKEEELIRILHYHRISSGVIRSHRGGRISRPSSWSTVMALDSGSSLTKPVRRQEPPRYHQMERKSFIHSGLMIDPKSSKLM